MTLPDLIPSRWSPVLVGTMIVRLIGAVCLVLGLFWLIDWLLYPSEPMLMIAAFRYLAVGGLLLMFEPMFVRWLRGGRLGSNSIPASVPSQELPLEEE